MLDRAHEYVKMAEVESTHWWYQALHHLVLAAIRKGPPGDVWASARAGAAFSPAGAGS